jgi:hypothetical protein
MAGAHFHLDDYADEQSGVNGAGSRKGRKSQLPENLPEQGDPPDVFAAFLTDFAHLHSDPVVSGSRYGTDGSEAIELVLRSGTHIRWAEQNHLFGPRLQRPFIMLTGHKPRSLSQHEVQLVAWAVVQFATLQASTSEIDEFRELWGVYLSGREMVVCDRADEKQMRVLLAQWKHLANGANEQPPFVLVDAVGGERLVRRLDFALHVHDKRSEWISWARLNGWAKEAGWELDRIQYRAARGQPYVQARVFVVRKNWEHEDE